MKRVIAKISQEQYDVAIIGGGIYGAWVAWDAALRGLKVLLIDKGDFANATSSNSQKIIHGGLRYLQHADFVRMRESIRERSTLMRVAPHLIHCLPCLIPTYGHLSRGKTAMTVALKLNDLISFDRNRGLPADKSIPNGRILSKDECLRLCAGLEQSGLQGGALFYDGQVTNSERLILAILHAAVGAGADIANYTKALGFMRDASGIHGLYAKDMFTDQTLHITARLTINCSGPWIHNVLHLDQALQHVQLNRLFKAIILVTRPIVGEVAVAVSAEHGYRDHDAVIDKGYRLFFITPWRNTSLVGTFYDAFDGDPATACVTEADICQGIAVTNAAYPQANLNRQDVRFAYGGLLPRADDGNTAGGIQSAKHYKIYDHEQTDNVRGLISVMGVKYTTARDVAQKVVDLVLHKLRKEPVQCQTNVIPVHGGAVDNMESLVQRAIAEAGDLVSAETIRHLVFTYGAAYGEILELLDENPTWGERVAECSMTIMAEVIHSVRREMAQTLNDVILRRTALGTTGYPGNRCLQRCAVLIAKELGWDQEKISQEVEETRAIYRLYERCL